MEPWLESPKTHFPALVSEIQRPWDETVRILILTGYSGGTSGHSWGFGEEGETVGRAGNSRDEMGTLQTFLLQK